MRADPLSPLLSTKPPKASAFNGPARRIRSALKCGPCKCSLRQQHLMHGFFVSRCKARFHSLRLSGVPFRAGPRLFRAPHFQEYCFPVVLRLLSGDFAGSIPPSGPTVRLASQRLASWPKSGWQDHEPIFMSASFYLSIRELILKYHVARQHSIMPEGAAWSSLSRI
ncbi:hypothetical protein ACLOJK_013607 [Asimina triloba]